MEKLVKSVNNIKQYYGNEAVDSSKKEPLPMATKSERQECCKVMAECVLSSSVKGNSEYNSLLGVTLETLLLCCQDAEADVRIAAEESINRIIKGTEELHFGKVLVEFYKEIKRNGSSRSLRAALLRFANLAHRIRPSKCRPYIVSLIPAFIRICAREDESIQECLSTSIAKIFPLIGSFASESEVQNLINALTKNLCNPSAAIRRNSASCIYEVISSSNKKQTMLFNTISELLELYADDNMDNNLILGSLTTLRYLVPVIGSCDGSITRRTGSFGSDKDTKFEVSFDDLLVKILEVCVHLFCSSDPSIVTSSLETLQALLKLPNDFLSNFFHLSALPRTTFSSTLCHLSQTLVKEKMKPSPTATVEVASPEVQVAGKNGLEDWQDEEVSKLKEDEEKDVSAVLKTFSNVNLETKPENERRELAASNSQQTELDSIDTGEKRLTQDSQEEIDGEVSLDSPQEVEAAIPVKPEVNSPKSEDSFVNQGKDLYSKCSPMKVVVSLLCERILQIGSDSKQSTRVSAKNLALSCISAIIKLQPELIFLLVHGEEAPRVSEIFSFRTFYDPQIRGATVISVAQYMVSSLVVSRCNYRSWLTEHCSEGHEDFDLSLLVSAISSGLRDESTVCIRACIQAISICLRRLLNSEYSHLGIQLLGNLLELKDTTYWLVKVHMLDVFGDVNFRQLLFGKETAHYVERLQNFAVLDDLHKNVLNLAYDALGDKDARVRKAASTMLVKSVTNSGIVIDSLKCDMAISEAAVICNMFRVSSSSDSAKSSSVKNLLQTYRGYQKMEEASHVTHSLSKLIGRLTQLLSFSTSKHLSQGCLQTLLALSNEYPVSKHPIPYSCHFIGDSQTPANMVQHYGLLPMLLSMLESTWPPLDISAHASVLSLAGNYLAGITYHGFQITGPNPKMSELETLLPVKGSTESSSSLSAILDPQLGALALRLVAHILKLLAMLHHVISETAPTQSNKSVLQSLQSAPSLPNTLKKKDKGDTKDIAPGNEPKSHKKSTSTGKLPAGTEDGEKEKSTKSSQNSPFSFAHSRLYMKVFEMLIGAYETYKTTLDSDETDKFTNFLQTVLDAICQVLEITTFDDIEKYTEDILMYLRTIFAVEPTMTVQTVQQLLKGLFGTNLVSQLDLDEHTRLKPPQAQGKDQQNYRANLYHQVFHRPLNDFTMAVANASFHHYLQQESTQKASTGWFGSIKKKVEKKLTMTAKRSKGDKMSIQNYIRLFESIVIKSLKNYTMTSSAEFQKHVLNLLAQLVQLRVNYCLLDSDQIFIGFIIKQFESIEGGFVRNSSVLIPHVFFFLVLLSYEKHHSKSVITMPKIIQLCDGVMASGCNASTHVIPALQPIVHDLFVLRAGMRQDSVSDLDTQREVTQSMLFRIIENPEVLGMVTTILQYYRKESPEQWKKYSRQVTDVLLPMISHLKLGVSSHSDVTYLHSLFEALSPAALRPIDLVLSIFFMLPTNLRTLRHHQRWIVKTIALLRVLLCHLKEDFLLQRVKEMQVDSAIFSSEMLLVAQKGVENVQNVEDDASSRGAEAAPLPEDVLSRIFLQIFGFTVERIVSESYDTGKIFTKESDLKLLSQLLNELILAVTYICRAGSFKRVTSAMRSLLTPTEDQQSSYFYSAESICDNFCLAASEYPLLPLLWTQLLTCIGFTDLSIWRKFTGKSNQLAPNSVPVLSNGIVHRGAIIMLADYICQNQSEVELMSWLIVNHMKEILSFHSEPPVQDFISAIHRSSPASGLFIESVRALLSSDANIRVSLKQSILLCMGGLHLNQSNAVLSLLFMDDWFLFSPVLALSVSSDQMACARAEMMLVQVHRNNDSSTREAMLSHLESLTPHVEKCRGVTRFGRIVGLIKRLKHMLATGEDDPNVIHEGRSDATGNNDAQELNKEWFKDLAVQFCNGNHKGGEVAQVLNVLDYEDILEVVSNEKFFLRHVEECLNFALEETTRPDDAIARYSNDFSCPLLKAVVETLTIQLDSFVEWLPKLDLDFMEHQDRPVFELCSENHSSVSDYWKNTFEILGSKSNPTLIFILARCWTTCLIWQNIVEQPFQGIQNLNSKLLMLAVACFEFLIKTAVEGTDFNSEQVLASFQLLHQVIRRPEVQQSFFSDAKLFDALVIAYGLQLLFQIFSNKVRQTISCGVIETSTSSCFSGNLTPLFIAVGACRLLDKVVLGELSDFPAELVELFQKSVQIVLCHPFFNTFARTPPLLFKEDMTSDELKGIAQESPTEYLQEKEMLREYVGRINCLGWISRMQFEETWTSLLGVLVSQPIGDISQNAIPIDENAIQISCLTISALTSMVVNAQMKPLGGQPATGSFQIIPRVKQALLPDNKIGHELKVIRCTIEKYLNDIVNGDKLWQKSNYFQAALNCQQVTDTSLAPCDVLRSRVCLNLERREFFPLYYGIGQRSVKSFRTLHDITPLDEEPSEISTDSENFGAGTSLDSSGSENDSPVATEMTVLSATSPPQQRTVQQTVDAHSCIQFLIDLYSEWFRSASTLSPGTPSGSSPSLILRLPRQFLCECLHSLILISDFFTERQQFEWMFNALNSLQLVQPAEDEVMLQYLVLGMCKAGAILGLNKKVCEIVTGMIEAAFNATLISCQTFALYGVLYVLEVEMREYMKSLVALISKFVLEKFKIINFDSVLHSQQLLRNVVSVGFYLVEKTQIYLPPTHPKIFVQGIITLLSTADIDTIPADLYVLLMQSLEMLITSYSLSASDCNAIAKLASDQFSSQALPARVLASLSLMVTCMYFRLLRISEASSSDEEAHESRLLSMERITLLFDKVKSGFSLKSDVLVRILPVLLDSFFATQNMMNKVIGEFVSSLHPHPEIVAVILHRVFQLLHARGESMVVSEWVMLSLGNFTQRKPIWMAIWCLTCVFISASSNHWVNSLLPIIMSQVKCPPAEMDFRCFYTAAKDFYVHQLFTPLDRRSFQSIFKSVAQPGNPYQNVLDIINELDVELG